MGSHWKGENDQIMNIFRIVLGKQHRFFNDCTSNNYVGVDFLMDIDFSDDLPENWRDFNKKYIPAYLDNIQARQN